jgi:hypothetical protein
MKFLLFSFLLLIAWQCTALEYDKDGNIVLSAPAIEYKKNVEKNMIEVYYDFKKNIPDFASSRTLWQYKKLRCNLAYSTNHVGFGFSYQVREMFHIGLSLTGNIRFSTKEYFTGIGFNFVNYYF